MTDDKQDPSVVAHAQEADLRWLAKNGTADVRLYVAPTGTRYVVPLSLTSDLTAMKAELEEVKKERDAQKQRADSNADHARLANANLADMDRARAANRARAEAAEQERDEWRAACMDARDGCNQRSETISALLAHKSEVLGALKRVAMILEEERSGLSGQAIERLSDTVYPVLIAMEVVK